MNDTVKLIIELPETTYQEVIGNRDTSNTNIYKAIRNGKPLSENKGEWIPVSERLPKNAEYVLATDGLDMFVAWHNPEKEIYKGWHSFDELFDVKTPIIAWQPLPEPYKEEGE